MKTIMKSMLLTALMSVSTVMMANAATSNEVRNDKAMELRFDKKGDKHMDKMMPERRDMAPRNDVNAGRRGPEMGRPAPAQRGPEMGRPAPAQRGGAMGHPGHGPKHSKECDRKLRGNRNHRHCNCRCHEHRAPGGNGHHPGMMTDQRPMRK